MIPIYRCGTRKAIDELAAELNLRFENWMQDWPIEVVSPADIDVYIDHYHKLTDDDKKFVLMQGILDTTEYQPTEELFLKYCSQVNQILEADFHLHAYTIFYYTCPEEEIIENCFRLTSMMREIYKRHANLT